MKHLYLVAIFFAVTKGLFAQTQPELLWQSSQEALGGVGRYIVRFDKYKNVYTSFNVYYDESTNHGTAARLVKYDSLGNVLWKYDTPPNLFYFQIKSLTVDSLGYAYVGVTYFVHVPQLFDHNTKLFKLSPDGDVVWQKDYLVTPYVDMEDFVYSEMDTLNAQLLMVGASYKIFNDLMGNISYYDFKLHAQATDTTNGNILWRTEFPGYYFYYNSRKLEDRMVVFYVKKKTDGLYYSVLHIGFDGTILGEYDHKYPPSFSQYTDFNHITEKGEILLGRRGGGYDVAKLTTYGDTLWTYSYLTPQGSPNGRVRSLKEDSQGNVYCTGGVVAENDTTFNYLTTKFDSLGNIIWQHMYQTAPEGLDIADAGILIDIGTEYVAAYGSSSIDESYTIFSHFIHFYTLESSEPEFTYMWQDSNGVTAHNLIFHKSNLYFQYTRNADLGTPTNTPVTLITLCIALPQTSSTHSTINPEGILTFPNPTDGQITFSKLKPGFFQELCIVDMKGQVLDCMKIDNQEQTSFTLSKYPAGTYLITLKGKTGTLQKKVIKL